MRVAGTAGTNDEKGITMDRANDFERMIEAIAEDSNLSKAAVVRTLRQDKVDLHHFQGDVIQLVPRKIHNSLLHSGTVHVRKRMIIRRYWMRFKERNAASGELSGLRIAGFKQYLAPIETSPDTVQALVELEQQVGSVPAPYRELLLQYGAFGFDGFARFDLPGPDSYPVFICWGAIGEYPITELVEEMPALAERGLIPFATDPFGNVYAWSNTTAEIWFLNIEGGDELIMIAPDMMSLLDSIQVEKFD